MDLNNGIVAILTNITKFALLAALAIVVLFSPPLLGRFYSLLAFYPLAAELEPIDIPPYRCQPVCFTGPQSNKLTGWFYKNPSATRTVLLSHGNAGNISHRVFLARHLLNANCSVFLYDYGGYGNSTGTPTPDSVCKEGLAAYDFLVGEPGIQPEQIILYGESLGCSVTSFIATQRNCAALILQSGFASLPAIAKDKFAFFRLFPDFSFPSPRLSNIDNLKTISGKPILVLHGVKDEVIPFKHAEQIATANSCRLVALPNAHHNDTFIVEGELFDKTLQEFLQSLPAHDQQTSNSNNHSAARAPGI